MTGEYDNAKDLQEYGVTFPYKTDGTVCVPSCEIDVIQSRIRVNATQSPVIFHVHGGGWESGEKSNPNTAIGFWLDRGYAFVSVQYRFPLLSPGATIQDMLDDVQDAWIYVVTNAEALQLDPTNIIFIGEDAGGHLATVVAYRAQDDGIRGVINLYGATEWYYYVNSGETNLKDKYFDKLIPENTSDAKAQLLFQEVSPSTYVNQNTPPTLTIHGDSDYYFPISMNKYLHDILSINNVKNALMRVPFAGHDLDRGWFSVGGQLSAYAMDQFFISRFK